MSSLFLHSSPSKATSSAPFVSESSQVREFTSGAGQPCPNKPSPMNDKEVDFITKMILDEVMELMATRYGAEEAKGKMISMIQDSKDIPKSDFSKHETQEMKDLYMAAEQVDALVDVYYYMQNAACKKGMNMSEVFKIVQKANMDKRDKVTGKFLKREDGKVREMLQEQHTLIFSFFLPIPSLFDVYLMCIHADHQACRLESTRC